jgi:hypothetical protein
MTKRREFLIGCQVAVAAAMLPSASRAADPASAGNVLRLRGGHSKAKFDAKLVQMQEGAMRPTHEEFTLVFEGGEQLPLERGIYNLRHRATGQFQLYLEQSEGETSRPLYKASLTLLV